MATGAAGSEHFERRISMATDVEQNLINENVESLKRSIDECYQRIKEAENEKRQYADHGFMFVNPDNGRLPKLRHVQQRVWWEFLWECVYVASFFVVITALTKPEHWWQDVAAFFISYLLTAVINRLRTVEDDFERRVEIAYDIIKAKMEYEKKLDGRISEERQAIESLRLDIKNWKA